MKYIKINLYYIIPLKDIERPNEFLNQLEKAALINDEAAKKTGYEQGLGLAVRKMIIKEGELENKLRPHLLASESQGTLELYLFIFEF